MSKAQLDHIIILIPFDVLKKLPNSLTSNFHITPGGRHGDNKTENCLIVLSDGVYLELIAFVDDSQDLKRGHWWGELPNGIIDFALTSSSVDDLAEAGGVRELMSKSQGGLSAKYQEPRAGSRIRGDGKEVKWFVTFPTSLDDGDKGLRRGSVPFWCHDVTDRELRVPAHDNVAVDHPSGATGVKRVVLGVPKGRLAAFTETYRTITGSQREPGDDSSSEFQVGTPFGPTGACAVVLQEFDEDEARVLKLVLTATNANPTRSINGQYGEGNEVQIEIRP